MGTQLEIMQGACCSQQPESLKADEFETQHTGTEDKEKQSLEDSSYSDQNETEASTPSNVTSIQSDGSVYTGEIRDDMKHGQGVQTWEDGSRHEGAWQCDEANGYGKFESADGNVYEGMWFNDQAHGKGKLVRDDGGIYEG